MCGIKVTFPGAVHWTLYHLEILNSSVRNHNNKGFFKLLLNHNETVPFVFILTKHSAINNSSEFENYCCVCFSSSFELEKKIKFRKNYSVEFWAGNLIVSLTSQWKQGKRKSSVSVMWLIFLFVKSSCDFPHMTINDHLWHIQKINAKGQLEYGLIIDN